MTAEKRTAVSKYDEAHIRDLLDRLDRQDSAMPGSPAASTNGAGGARRERRFPYARSGIMVAIEHPGGGITKVPSHARCIWGDGIAVLAAAFSYPKSTCTVTLISKDGDLLSANGVVSACKHVEGSLHELEIKFSKRIDPTLFQETPKVASGAAADPIDLGMLRGRVLYLDDSELDHRLFAHHLRGSKMELKFAKTAAEALEVIGKGAMDIFVCDLHLGQGVEGTQVVKEARSAGFGGPVVMLTAEHAPDKLAAVKAAGADHVLSKPYQKSALVELITKLNQQVGAATSDDLLYSTLDDQAEMAELLSSFITTAQEISQRLESAVSGQNLETVRELCLNIKGSAIGYGFAPLGSAAEDAIKSLDGTMSVEESRPRLRALMLMCGRLAIHTSSSETPAAAA